MATAATEVQTKFQMLDLGKISESPMNPRKHFDAQSLKELAESIKAHGVQQPIVVRPDGHKHDRFEIVVGARRSRAAKLAGVKEIPAVIRELSNAAALEIMVIENLQREDVHPLDEALGYEALMKKASETDPELGELPGAPRHTAESIAAKVGKSVGYVYARLKLLALVPAAREAFEQDRITPGHAVLIARLTPADQIRGLHACFHPYFDEREVKKLDPLTVKFADIEEDPLAALIPEKGLREWIQENINLRLKDVPWDLDDEKLVPEAGACATCVKRSTSNPALFAELAVKNEDTCFDAACFQKKRSEFVKIQLYTDKVKVRIAEKEGTEAAEKLLQLSDMNAYTKPKPDQAVYRAGQWISAKPGSCADVKPGILVRGENAGQRKNVCINPSCKVHKHQLHGERAAGGQAASDSYEEQDFQRHRQSITETKKARARGVLCQAIVKNVGAKMLSPLLREIADTFLNDRDVKAETVSWLLGEKKPLTSEQIRAAIAKADGAKLNQIVIALLLEDSLGGWNADDKRNREHLTGLAKSIGMKHARVILTGADVEIGKQKSCRACGCTEQIPCTYWNGSKHVQCSWKEANLCSNEKCVGHEKRVAAKKAKAGK